MFDLFRQYRLSGVGAATPPQWPYVKRHVRENVKTYQQYYRNSNTFINAENILVDLLYSLATPMELDASAYVTAIEFKYRSSAMSLGLTSEVSFGRKTKPVFFGRNTTEILVAYNETFDVQAAEENWQDIVAVKTLSHPFTIFGMPEPFSQHEQMESGPIVIGIDVPKLALQYRCYILSQNGNEDTYGAMNFLAQYVWPNMMPSYLEQTWFNRVASSVVGAKPQRNKTFKLPFQLPNLLPQLDNCEHVIDDTISNFISNDFTYLLKSIPSLFSDDMLQALILPEVTPTTQITWALDLSRLKHIAYLILVNNAQSVGPSKEDLQQCVRSIIHNYVERYMQQHLPQSLFLQQSHYLAVMMYYYKN